MLNTPQSRGLLLAVGAPRVRPRLVLVRVGAVVLDHHETRAPSGAWDLLDVCVEAGYKPVSRLTTER
jgi:hypothetical protein